MLEDFRSMTAEELAREVSKIVAALSDAECAALLGDLRQMKARDGLA